MELLISKRLERDRARLKQFAERHVLTSPERILDEKRMMLLSDERLVGAAKLLISKRRTTFDGYAGRLRARF